MIENYFKAFIRQLEKNYLISGLSLLGLVIGITSSILISYYSFYENTYDRFHENESQIYRVVTHNYKNNEHTRSVACTPTPIGKTMLDEISEIEDYTRFAFCGNAEVNYLDKSLYEENINFVEPSFFDFFAFPLKEGNNFQTLNDPNTIFLSESFAKKIFGNENPINKNISVVSNNKKHYCTVKGIFFDLPENTYFNINAAISFKNFYYKWGENMDENWTFHILHTFVKLNQNSDYKTVEKKLELLADKYMGEFFKKSNVYRKYTLQPLNKIYLHSDLLYELGKNGDGKSIKYLNIIALIIILISSINFLNLQSSQAIGRVKEVMIRKINGGSKFQLFNQVLFECVISGLFIGILSLVLFLILKTKVQELVSKNIEITESLWLAFFLFIVIICVLPGIYLSNFLTTIKSIEVLKGKNKIANTKFSNVLKKALLVFQFIVSFCFIVFSLTINKQIKYANKKDLRINIDNTLIIKKPFIPSIDSSLISNFSSFFYDLNNSPMVKNVAQSITIPGEDIILRQRFRKRGDDLIKEEYCSVTEIDHNYLKNYEHKLISGNITSNNYYKNRIQAILNEEAINLLNFKSPDDAIGRVILAGNIEIEIIGVIENYHQQSLKNNYLPTVMIIREFPTGYLSVKYIDNKYQSLIKDIRKNWKKYFPQSPLQIFQLNDFFQKQYSSENVLNRIILILSIISIIISFLGISGVSLKDITNRTKEIGIRKILGSTIIQLIFTYLKSYLILFLIAIIIGIPLCYKLIENWLNKFAFKINFPWEYFFFTGIFLLIMLISVISSYILHVSTYSLEKAIKEE